LTAYYVAANAVRTSPNVWDNALYSASDDDPSQPRKPLMMGPFQVDVFEYPPPFLLLPKAVAAITPDFMDLRALWFAINLLGMVGAMIAIARALGPEAGTRALLLMPFVFLSPPTLSVLQKGNVQGLIIAASMVAMLLISRGRVALGGAILAFAIASKIYPGLLVVYLIARREWRAVGWTAACGVAWCLATMAALGWGPWEAFLRHFPSILSGEAFPAFRRAASMAVNLSIPGLVFKAKLFGAPGMGFAASKAVGWL
jgi:alpha-1,2-mannosyltransferase